MDKSKLISGFIITTFVSLYVLVSVVSTIHVIDFFELSNPRWLAITLAVGFEIGAAASLASLITLDKMNKTIVWALFITITAMQMQGNMYYAFINLENYTGWVELFNLLEWEALEQKRLLAFVSGAILPLVALGFIKSLVDYVKPEKEIAELSPSDLEEVVSDINGPKKKVISKEDDLSDWDVTLSDGLKDLDVEFDYIETEPELTEKGVETIIEANDNPKEPIEALKDAAIKHGAFGEVKPNPGFIPFEMRGINSRDNGLTAQSVENRTVKGK
jgi:hypothetical protein